MGVRILEGLAADCAEALFDRYFQALDDGLSSQSVLALVEPQTRQSWMARLDASGRERLEDRVMTPFSWVKRELELWWPAIEARLVAPRDPLLAIEPMIVQMDMAQYLMERFTAPYRQATDAFRQSRTPRGLRYIHLLDSLARGIENLLSPAEIAERLATGVGRPEERIVLADVGPCLERYRESMLAHRLLDQALAWDCFVNLLLVDPRYRAHLAASTRMLLVEALDEATPLALRAYQIVAEGCERVCFGFRRDGGQREYLGADPAAARQAWPEADIEEVSSGGASIEAAGKQGLVLIERTGYLDMLEALAQDLALALEGSSPGDLAIVAPSLDPLLIFWLRSKLATFGLPLVLEAGSHRLLDHPSAEALLSAALLAPAGPLADRLTRDQWLGLLEHVTGGDPFALAPIAGRLAVSSDLPDRMELAELSDAQARRFGRLVGWLARQGSEPARSLSGLLASAFSSVLGPCLVEQTRGEGLSLDGPGPGRLAQMAKLVDAAERFDRVLDRLGEPDAVMHRLGLLCGFLRSGAIAERSDPGLAPEQAVVLATASQLSQGARAFDIQFWLDVASARWWKSDARELTNARVLRRTRPLGPYGPDEDQRDMDAKLDRVLLACAARTRREIRAYASIFDAAGRENTGGLVDRLAGKTSAEGIFA